MKRLLENRACGWFAVLVIACSPAICVAEAEGPWTLGHGDLGVGYDEVNDVLEFEVHLHEGATVDGVPLMADDHGQPGAITIVVPVSANLQRIHNPTGFFDGSFDGYDFTPSGFNVTGTTVGGNLWMLGSSADASHYGTPFVGLSAEELLPASSWNGTVSFVLDNVTFDGSAYGTSNGTLSFFNDSLSPLWSSQDSFTQIPIELTPGDGHDHGFFFFSQPGIYEMTLLASGTHSDPLIGEVTGTGTFRFEVVPEPSTSVMLAGLGFCATIGAGISRRRRLVRSTPPNASAP